MKINKQFQNLLNFFILLLVVSCTNEEYLSDEYNQTLNLEKIENVIDLTGQSQKIAYKLLNETEKIYIWKAKLSKLISTQKLSNSQENYIKELERTLTKENFSSSNESSYYSEYLKEMKKIGYILFSSKEMFIFFSSLSFDIEQVQLSNKSKSVHCNCNSADDWCPWGSKCLRWGCATEDIGCGWWMGEDCNGVCVSN